MKAAYNAVLLKTCDTREYLVDSVGQRCHNWTNGVTLLPAGAWLTSGRDGGNGRTHSTERTRLYSRTGLLSNVRQRRKENTLSLKVVLGSIPN